MLHYVCVWRDMKVICVECYEGTAQAWQQEHLSHRHGRKAERGNILHIEIWGKSGTIPLNGSGEMKREVRRYWIAMLCHGWERSTNGPYPRLLDSTATSCEWNTCCESCMTFGKSSMECDENMVELRLMHANMYLSYWVISRKYMSLKRSDASAIGKKSRNYGIICIYYYYYLDRWNIITSTW